MAEHTRLRHGVCYTVQGRPAAERQRASLLERAVVRATLASADVLLWLWRHRP